MASNLQHNNSVYLKIESVSEAIRLCNILRELRPIDPENYIFTNSLAARLERLLKTPPPLVHLGEPSIIIHFFPVSEARRFLGILFHAVTTNEFDYILVKTLHARLLALLNSQ